LDLKSFYKRLCFLGWVDWWSFETLHHFIFLLKWFLRRLLRSHLFSECEIRFEFQKDWRWFVFLRLIVLREVVRYIFFNHLAKIIYFRRSVDIIVNLGINFGILLRNCFLALKKIFVLLIFELNFLLKLLYLLSHNLELIFNIITVRSFSLAKSWVAFLILILLHYCSFEFCNFFFLFGSEFLCTKLHVVSFFYTEKEFSIFHVLFKVLLPIVCFESFTFIESIVFACILIWDLWLFRS